MLSFEVLHVEIAQELQVSKISLIFSNFSVNFQFHYFFAELSKNILKKDQIGWKCCHLSGEHDFWAEFGSTAKNDRGL